jgi:two-component system cell cycle response regulator
VPLMLPELVRLSINPSERPGRIALVEAEPARREALSRVLASEGYQVQAVSELGELEAMRSAFAPELVLCSQARAASPLELIAQLRAGYGSARPLVILVGSAADEATIAAALYAGADDYVADIGRTAELRARIRVQLRNRRTLETLQRVKTERDSLRQDAQIDPLTGLLNRRSLETDVRERCQSGKRFGVLFMDIDHFKSINDRYGHVVGDRVLAALGTTLRSTLRPEDAVCRYGGEEFVALIADAGAESARLVAERLRLQVEGMAAVPGGPPSVTLSVGTTVHDPQKHRESEAELMRRADAALYAAKRGGRNRVVVLAPGAEVSKQEPAAPVLALSPSDARPRAGEKA